MDYKSAGVSISEADKLIHWLKNQVSTSSAQKDSRLLLGIGSYSGLFKAVFPGIREPCLAASTDGVGTKLLLASHFQRYSEVAQDLVAMCLNDLICCGAQPLFFMDYYATGALRQKPAQEFLKGIRSACEKSHCVLLGGETAEMPDCYRGTHFDCAGFGVGVVDRSKMLGKHKVMAGDRLIGVSSSGFHSNGFSLLRKVFQKDTHLWEEELLKPTALYVSLAKDLCKFEGLKAIAHITGGGLDNLLRVLPQGIKAEMNIWEIPHPFREVKRRSGMSWESLLKTFNCGIGLVLVVSQSIYPLMCQKVIHHGFSAFDLGKLNAGKQQSPSWSLPLSRLSVYE